MARYRVTVDTGGTFSDFVFFDESSGEITITKVPSTPREPFQAVLNGVKELLDRGVAPGDVSFFCHGTTVGTNALLEEKGARTGLLVTEGFRGIYEVMEQTRGYGPATYDLFFEKPKLLATPYYTEEIPERIDFQGRVLKPIDVEASRRAVLNLKKKGVQSVAVCFLFSFLNPVHELAVKEIFAREFPEARLSLSCEVLPQIREFYRMSTTVINAYIAPVMASYLSRLEGKLREMGVSTPKLYIMQSNGGVSTFEGSARKPVATVLSGPAGGVIASMGTCERVGIDNIITFDMGGTSCDVALIHRGKPVVTTQGRISQRPISLPMLDIHTVSAGGGTIARLDAVGALQVGPDSAGADPGPVCYGRGGENVTITDANLVVGVLDPDHFLGGRMKLDKARAERALQEKIARPLGLSLLEAADGILNIINVKMEEAIKAVSSQRGYDIRDFTLVAFGGGGPMHAGRMALDLGIPAVLVPPTPGVHSALGLLMSDVKHDYVRSKLAGLEELDCEEVNRLFAELIAEAKSDLTAEGFGDQEIRIEPFLDLRYAGQGYELTVPCPMPPLAPSDLASMRQRFDAQHEQVSGHKAESEPVELVSVRLVSIGLVPQARLSPAKRTGRALEQARTGERRVYFGPARGTLPCAIYARERLEPGHAVPGPAIVEQLDTTTVIQPEQIGTVDDYGNLIIKQKQ
ncbi:MAG TPA: hydantoinase/oxoprolinase family protein [candidate division Zixibacteria bacterium]|nr:hydantoinase/oxoprolinase family protein [candidate division Zixibacteria bacterium]